jgi:hypothetical protein
VEPYGNQIFARLEPVLPSVINRSLFLCALLSAALCRSVLAQPSPADGPLLVYAETPITVETLKRTYGESVVTKVGPGLWVVDKRLRLGEWFDSFSYKENERGEMVEMTGFAMGKCESVLQTYFQTLAPIQNGQRGRPLQTTAYSDSVRIDVPATPDHPIARFGGQSVGLSFDKRHPSAPCMMTWTFKRKDA